MTYDMIGPDEKRTVGVALTDAELAEMRDATGAGTNSQAVVSAARVGTKWLRTMAERLASAAAAPSKEEAHA